MVVSAGSVEIAVKANTDAVIDTCRIIAAHLTALADDLAAAAALRNAVAEQS
jgi:hypothetical protein